MVLSKNCKFSPHFSRTDNPKVIINIGGSRFEVFQTSNTFKGFKSSPLQVMWKCFEPRILSRLGKLYRAKTHQADFSTRGPLVLILLTSVLLNLRYWLDVNLWAQVENSDCRRSCSTWTCTAWRTTSSTWTEIPDPSTASSTITGPGSFTVLTRFVPWTTLTTSSFGWLMKTSLRVAVRSALYNLHVQVSQLTKY